MARPHRPARGSVYDKRRSAGQAAPAPPPSDAMSSTDARHLGGQIESAQARYKVTAIRLLTGRACALVLLDSQTGTEHTLTSARDWHRLQAT
jgi:hypothetical protein